jgi:hypothetical protein
MRSARVRLGAGPPPEYSPLSNWAAPSGGERPLNVIVALLYYIPVRNPAESRRVAVVGGNSGPRPLFARVSTAIAPENVAL